MPVATEREARISDNNWHLRPKKLTELRKENKKNLTKLFRKTDSKTKKNYKHIPDEILRSVSNTAYSEDTYTNQVEEKITEPVEQEEDKEELEMSQNQNNLMKSGSTSPSKKGSKSDLIAKKYRARTITIYTNDDPKVKGITMALSKSAYPTFESLLNYISKRIQIPGGVHKIYTKDGKVVDKLSKFDDEGQYVASNSTFTAMDYGSSEAAAWKISKRVERPEKPVSKKKSEEEETGKSRRFIARHVPEFVKRSKKKVVKGIDDDGEIPRRRDQSKGFKDRARSASPILGRNYLGRFGRTKDKGGYRDWRRRGSDIERVDEDEGSEEDIVTKRMRRKKDIPAKRDKSKKTKLRNNSPSKKISPTRTHNSIPPQSRGILKKQKKSNKTRKTLVHSETEIDRTSSADRETKRALSRSSKTNSSRSHRSTSLYANGPPKDRRASNASSIRSTRRSSIYTSRQSTPNDTDASPPATPHKANSTLMDEREERRSAVRSRVSSRMSNRSVKGSDSSGDNYKTRKGNSRRPSRNVSRSPRDNQENTKSRISQNGHIDRWSTSQDRRRSRDLSSSSSASTGNSSGASKYEKVITNEDFPGWQVNYDSDRSLTRDLIKEENDANSEGEAITPKRILTPAKNRRSKYR